MRRALQADGVAWVVLAALLCAGALLVTTLCAAAPGSFEDSALARALEWQAALGLHEPWRLWTCAWVHGSRAHLLVNVAGAAVVAFVGWRGRLPASAALAWFAAWPLVQLAMAAIGAERLGAVMPRYDGLSGVLHAGVVVAGLSLAWPLASGATATVTAPMRMSWTRERWIGVAMAACTAAKVLSEAPWNLAPRPSAALGIAVAPVAHACGVAAGALAWALLRLARRHRR